MPDPFDYTALGTFLGQLTLRYGNLGRDFGYTDPAIVARLEEAHRLRVRGQDEAALDAEAQIADVVREMEAACQAKARLETQIKKEAKR